MVAERTNPIGILAELLVRARAQHRRNVERSIEKIAARILLDVAPAALGISSMYEGSVATLQAEAMETASRLGASVTGYDKSGSGTASADSRANAIVRQVDIEERVAQSLRNANQLQWFIRQCGYGEAIERPLCKACRSKLAPQINQMIVDGVRIHDIALWTAHNGDPISRSTMYEHARHARKRTGAEAAS